MGFDERGRCPMLGDDGCSIYEHRPRTCRAYDCRVFTAAGIEPDPDQAAVGRRVQRWQFSYRDADAGSAHDAARAAARGGDPAVPATHRAVAAVRVVLAARRAGR